MARFRAHGPAAISHVQVPGGEGGTTPALGASVNAIVDALADLGVEHLEMPVTPERVWDAIRAAQRGRDASQSCSGATRAST